MKQLNRLRILIPLVFTATLAIADSPPESGSYLDAAPSFNADDELELPENLDQWVHLGTMLGPQYTDEDFDPKGPNQFHVALMEPAAYDAFLETGEFADGTMFALQFYNAVSELSIQKSGFLMGDITLTEIHLKDKERFPDGFNFYVYPSGTTVSSALALPNDCVVCHEEHGAIDGVFAQFYPALRDKIVGK